MPVQPAFFESHAIRRVYVKERLGKEGRQPVTNCHRLKMTSSEVKPVVTGENFLPPAGAAPRKVTKKS